MLPRRTKASREPGPLAVVDEAISMDLKRWRELFVAQRFGSDLVSIPKLQGSGLGVSPNHSAYPESCNLHQPECRDVGVAPYGLVSQTPRPGFGHAAAW